MFKIILGNFLLKMKLLSKLCNNNISNPFYENKKIIIIKNYLL